MIRALNRSVRSLVLRFALAVIGWPHLVDIVLRTKRTPVATTPKHQVWEDNGIVLWRYDAPGPRRRTPVLLVHSLVTQPWILDLTPTRSLVASLLAQGFDVFLLDWGDIGWRQARRGLDDCLAALGTAEEQVLAASGASRVHVVGYCFGATLALLRLITEPANRAASFVAIAPPVDLSAPGGFRSTLGSRLLRPGLLLDSGHCVPSALVREAFHFLRPMALRTVWRRLRSRAGPEERAYHAAMARWTWEHRRLPGALLHDLKHLYRTNPLPGRLDRVQVPTFVAVAAGDHIVPWGSSAPLTQLPAHVETLVCPSGHVSMLVGTAGQQRLWPALGRWLGARRAA